MAGIHKNAIDVGPSSAFVGAFAQHEKYKDLISWQIKSVTCLLISKAIGKYSVTFPFRWTFCHIKGKKRIHFFGCGFWMYWQSCWGGKQFLVSSPVSKLQIHLRSGLKQASCSKLRGNLVSRVVLSWLLLKQSLPIQCDNENYYPLGAKLCPPNAWFPLWSTFSSPSSWNCVVLWVFLFVFEPTT